MLGLTIPQSGRFLAALLPIFASFVSHGQELRFQETRQTFSTMSAAVDALSSKYNIRVGLEYDVTDPDQIPITLALSSSSVDTLFDSLVAQKPSYIWKKDAGVYDVYPNSRVESLLDLNIQAFEVNNATIGDVSAAIDKIPEVKEWMSRHHARRNELETGPRWKDSGQRFSLSISGVSLRTVLNRIIEVTGRPTWAVVRYGEQAKFVGIYI